MHRERRRLLASWRRARGKAASARVEPEDLAFELARVEVPVIRPAAQAHLVENKLHNLRLAASRLHGLEIAPGEIVSFWDVVGEPIEERGYKDGPSFLRHVVTSSVGGGLCQLSGLLYGVALRAGCAIEERWPHSIDAYGDGRYLPLGFDATVTFPRKDLVFRNALGAPLCVSILVEDHRVVGALRCARDPGLRVSLESETVRVVPSPVETVFAAEERVDRGFDGAEVIARRTLNGRVETLSRDVYKATPTVVFTRATAAAPGVAASPRRDPSASGPSPGPA